MITCPKCGFTQPPDQYCARCGIDMSAYKPRKAPVLKRLLGNTYFQFLIIALVVVLAVGYILNREKERQEFRKALLEDDQVYQQAERFAKRDREYEEKEAVRKKPRKAPTPKRVQPKAVVAKNNVAKAPPLSRMPSVRMFSAEISEEFLNEIFYQSTFDGGYGDQRFAIVPNLGGLISQGKSEGLVAVRGTSGRQSLKLRETTTSTFNNLNMQFTPNAANARGLDLDLTISASIDEVAEESPTLLRETLSLPPGSGLVITGLQREEISEEEVEEAEEAPSPSVIFFEFSSSPRRANTRSGQSF